MTIKCATSNEAKLLENKITQKYRGQIKVNKVSDTKPLIKIANLPTDITDDEPTTMLNEQNFWLRDRTFTAHKSYIIKLDNREYKNLVVETDVTTQKEILERGTVIIGFSERRCFESINTIQCLKCFRYGHIQHECKFEETCKKCADKHSTASCTSETIKCSNCTAYNKNKPAKEQYRNNRIATDDRCLVRRSRIEALKNLYYAP